jgi:hypothetical protein
MDVLLIDKSGKRGIFVECKFTSNPMPHGEYKDLMNDELFGEFEGRGRGGATYLVFSLILHTLLFEGFS